MLDWRYFISSFVIGVVGWFTYKVYIWPYYISPLRKIPGPPSENLLSGNLKRIFVEEAGEPILRWVKEYGNIVKYYELLNKPVVLVADAKIVQDITITNAYDYIKPPNADAKAVAGEGILLSEGDDHKRQRKMMNPAFTHHNIKEMVPTFTHVGLTLKGLIEDMVNVGEAKINLTPYISKATLDIIGSVGFNYEFNSLTSPNELAEAYHTLMSTQPTPLRIILSILSNYIPSVRKIPIHINKRFHKNVGVIERVSEKLVRERCNEVESKNLIGKDLLSLLVNINKTLPIEEKMTFNELKYQIMTFLMAGHETTSVTTCWALHLLAQNPQQQDLLREEIVKAFPDKSKFNPTFDEINSLEYLNCVVKETLRLNSPVTATRRLSVKDKVFGGYFIPKDTVYVIAIAVLHRLPSIWGPTADDFDPKRWLNLNDSYKSNFLPFLTGPKSCIGNKLALTEIKILLSLLIRNFVFQPVEGLHIRKKLFPFTKPDPYLELNVSRVEA